MGDRIDYESVGAINIPIYPTSSADDYAYVLNHFESKVFFVSNPELLAKATEAKKNCPGVETHFLVLKRSRNSQLERVSLEREKMARETSIPTRHKCNADLTIIIYTSGTTGKPKGVMLSHENILSNVEASAPRLPIDAGSRAISFLPLCHIYERMLMYLYQRAGTQVRFQETLEDLGARIREAEPEVFTAVPRLLEKIYDSILRKAKPLRA
ncbi:MAG: AMP-binding protein [Flavobacteriales bacterium]|nr:AMP-binding protein [Flavobacteriales bacterium]